MQLKWFRDYSHTSQRPIASAFCEDMWAWQRCAAKCEEFFIRPMVTVTDATVVSLPWTHMHTYPCKHIAHLHTHHFHTQAMCLMPSNEPVVVNPLIPPWLSPFVKQPVPLLWSCHCFSVYTSVLIHIIISDLIQIYLPNSYGFPVYQWQTLWMKWRHFIGFLDLVSLWKVNAATYTLL